MSARVTAAFGLSSEYVAYTIDRPGPPPRVTHCSQAVVAVVHGATGATNGVRREVRTAAMKPRSAVRMRTMEENECGRVLSLQHYGGGQGFGQHRAALAA